MKLSFIDASVLIQAGRGTEESSQVARDIIFDPDRQLAASFYLMLEVLPKAQYHQRKDEIAFYQLYSTLVSVWATDWEAIHLEAQKQASLYGIGAMDALHIAAAILVGADEFVTAEREGKSLFRTPDIRVVSIRPPASPILP